MIILQLQPFGFFNILPPPPPGLISSLGLPYGINAPPIDTLTLFQILHGHNRQATAAFLFNRWADLHGSDSGSLKQELKRFNRDVISYYRPKAKRGAPRKAHLNKAVKILTAHPDIGIDQLCKLVFKRVIVSESDPAQAKKIRKQKNWPELDDHLKAGKKRGLIKALDYRGFIWLPQSGKFQKAAGGE